MKGWNRSRTKKVLCRLMGDRTGGVMMEYVILAVLIAAAVVVAVAMFGKTIVGMFDVAGKGATTRHSEAKSALEATRSTQDSDADKAKDYHDGMHE
jgi:Flp pilus assembly pilin Flp